MGRIVVINNVLDPAHPREYAHSGPFVDFLLEHYPAGFPGAHQAAFNLKQLSVDDYDREIGEDDVVVLAIAPGFWAALVPIIINALIGAAIATVLTFVINKFFGPRGTKPTTPSAADANGVSSTYSLNTPTNVARIGQPIPVAYGRNLLVPDLASSPYKFYRDNNEYLVLMFCLGMGKFQIHDILVGDTPVRTLTTGLIPDLRVWGPFDHGQTFGNIQEIYGWPSGFHENVYTSPEVSGQELVTGAAGTAVATTYSGTGVLYNDAYGNNGGFTLDPYVSPAILYGSPLWMRVTASGANDGVYQVGELYIETDPTLITSGFISGRPAWPVSQASASILMSHDATFSDIDDGYSGPGIKIGPFNCGGREVITEVIQCDVTLPNGLFSVNQTTGALQVLGVSVWFYSEMIDENDNYVNRSGAYYFHVEAADKTPLKYTVEWAVPRGRHRVWARRESPKEWGVGSQSDIFWTGLKSVLGNTFLSPANTLTYEHTTLITVIAKATEGLASDALSRFSVDCTRELEGWGGATRNPAHSFYDAYTNFRYGGARPESELDMDTLEALAYDWQYKTFDAVFDQPSTLWEALGLILQMVHAAPTVLGSIVSVVQDKDYSVGTFALTESTIKGLTMTYMFSDGEDADGVEGEYRDPTDNAALYVCWPAPAERPESVTLWGCRDYDSAMAFVQQRWRQLVYRRRLIKLETELEGHVLPVGSPVTVQHPLLGLDPVLCVVDAVNPQEEFSISIDLHVHQSEVYA